MKPLHEEIEHLAPPRITKAPTTIYLREETQSALNELVNFYKVSRNTVIEAAILHAHKEIIGEQLT